VVIRQDSPPSPPRRYRRSTRASGRMGEPPVLWGITLAVASDLLETAHGTPLIGLRAPPQWRRAYCSSGGGVTDTVLTAVLEAHRLYYVASASVAALP